MFHNTVKYKYDWRQNKEHVKLLFTTRRMTSHPAGVMAEASDLCLYKGTPISPVFIYIVYTI